MFQRNLYVPAVFGSVVVLSLACRPALTHESGSHLSLILPRPLPWGLQLPAGDEPLNAPLHDSGMDLLCGCDHQGHRVREGGAAEGDHAHHGPGQRHPVVQLVHQQPHPSARERRPAGGHPESKAASPAPPCWGVPNSPSGAV